MQSVNFCGHLTSTLWPSSVSGNFRVHSRKVILSCGNTVVKLGLLNYFLIKSTYFVLKALFNNVFTFKNLSCMSLHATSMSLIRV